MYLYSGLVIKEIFKIKIMNINEQQRIVLALIFPASLIEHISCLRKQWLGLMQN